MNGEEPAQEQTFADVLNGLSRTRRSKRVTQETSAASSPSPTPAPVEVPVEESASIVRAYTWTGGRTRFDVPLEVETLVSTTHKAEALLDSLRSEHQAIAQLCRRSTSVAEVGALMSLPLGVVRVLLSDMAELGLIEVHESTAGEQPDIDLLERVLRGLTNLRG